MSKSLIGHVDSSVPDPLSSRVSDHTRMCARTELAYVQVDVRHEYKLTTFGEDTRSGRRFGLGGRRRIKVGIIRNALPGGWV